MDPPPALDPVIHQPARLRIMAALHRNRQASFTQLRDGLGLTDGNLASHAQKLVDTGYVDARRVLLGRDGFQLRYRITQEGAMAFQAYATALGVLLGDAGVTPAAEPAPDDVRPAPG